MSIPSENSFIFHPIWDIPNDDGHGKKLSNECHICVRKFHIKDKLTALTCCSNFLHTTCLLRNFAEEDNKCPFCKRVITSLASGNRNYPLYPDLFPPQNVPDYEEIESESDTEIVIEHYREADHPEDGRFSPYFLNTRQSFKWRTAALAVGSFALAILLVAVVK